jgi:enoyl-CoA hydratase/carnithine racemase
MNESLQDPVVLSISDSVATLMLSRPGTFNALSRSLTDCLDGHLARLETRDEVRVVLIQAQGKHFCAGADIADMANLDYEGAVATDFIGCSRRLGSFPKPVVAAVQGMALGGGCELVEMCDIVVAAEDASFAHPEITLCAMPGAGGTQRLPRAVGKHLAMDMLFTARRLSAQEALLAGLVSRVVPAQALSATATDIARAVANRPTSLLVRLKQSVLNAYPALPTGLQAEARYFRQCFEEPTFSEALREFIEKRKPRQ